MGSNDIKISIGSEDNTVNGASKINFLLEATVSNSVTLSCRPRLEISGGLNGWATFDFMHHVVKLPADSPIEFSLSPGQNIFSILQLGKLIYANNLGSASPALSWRQFLRDKSPINVDIEIQTFCDFEDEHGNVETVESNVIHSKLGAETEDHELILDEIEKISLILQNLSLRLYDIENRLNNP